MHAGWPDLETGFFPSNSWSSIRPLKGNSAFRHGNPDQMLSNGCPFCVYVFVWACSFANTDCLPLIKTQNHPGLSCIAFSVEIYKEEYLILAFNSGIVNLWIHVIQIEKLLCQIHGGLFILSCHVLAVLLLRTFSSKKKIYTSSWPGLSRRRISHYCLSAVEIHLVWICFFLFPFCPVDVLQYHPSVRVTFIFAKHSPKCNMRVELLNCWCCLLCVFPHCLSHRCLAGCVHDYVEGPHNPTELQLL